MDTWLDWVKLAWLKKSGLLILLLIPTLVLAEPARVVFHINDSEKLPLLLNNTLNLKKDLGPAVEIQVVVNGPAITRLASFANTGDSLQKMLDAGIELGGCSNAMRNNNLDPSKLYPGVKIINEGGVTRLLRLQQQGYAYIKI